MSNHFSGSSFFTPFKNIKGNSLLSLSNSSSGLGTSLIPWIRSMSFSEETSKEDFRRLKSLCVSSSNSSLSLAIRASVSILANFASQVFVSSLACFCTRSSWERAAFTPRAGILKTGCFSRRIQTARSFPKSRILSKFFPRSASGSTKGATNSSSSKGFSSSAKSGNTSFTMEARKWTERTFASKRLPASLCQLERMASLACSIPSSLISTE